METLLQTAIDSNGGLIVRQFLSLKVERLMPNGKRIWVPKKNVYGVMMGNGTWQALSAQSVQHASCVDATTGKPLPPEDDVTYLKFPVWTEANEAN
jgi:hypothetical protein